jgi:hypothetical protein
VQSDKTYKTVVLILYNAQYVRYNYLVSNHKGNKKPSPHRISSFAGYIADILLADTYIIAAAVAFVK